MDRARLRALSLVAAALIGCGPGEHSQKGGFDQLFGGGAAGKGKAEAASVPDEDDSIIDDSEPAAQSNGTRRPASASAGTRATPRDASAAMSGDADLGSAPPPGGSPDASADPEPPAGSDPSGPGASANPEPGIRCAPGFVFVGGECACDLNGTFALHGTAAVSYEGMAPIEALNDSIDLWGIVQKEYDIDGNLQLTLTACGQTTPDICAAAQAPILPAPEAYAQYISVEVWDKPSSAAAVQLSLPAARPGAAFDTPTIVQLFGVSLANPLGAWPASRKDVEGGADYDGSATNGARWVDLDADGKPGVTIRAVGPGGVAATATSGPPRSYAAKSEKCPRSNAGATRSPYAYVPLPQGLGVRRIKTFYSAQRVAIELHGALDTCDRISGKFTGPKGGKVRLDALVGGCAIVNGSGESACGAALLDAADAAGGGATGLLELGSGDFVLARAPADVTCTQVRAMNLK